MSAYTNQVTIIGNVGSDPVEIDGKGNTIAKFSVAVERSSKSEKVDWIPCAAFHDLARGILANISKGDAVIVSGTWQVDSKKNDDGETRTFHNLNINVIGKQIFGIKKEEDNREEEDDVPF